MKRVIFKSLMSELFVCLILLTGCSPKNAVKEKMVGVYISDHSGDFDKLFTEFNDLGINTVFASSPHLVENRDFYTKAKEHDIEVFVTANMFHADRYLGKNKDAYSITDKGSKGIESWLRFTCPSHDDYRKEYIEKYTDLVREYNPDGIELNFVRYFIFWEMVDADVPAEELPVSCFCDLCLERFQKDSNITIDPELKSTEEKARWILDNHKDDFTRWKCEQIASWVKDISVALREVKPDIKIQVFTVPWTKDEYDNGIRRVVGQDYSLWKEYVDVISPMAYYNLTGRPPEKIEELVNEINGDTGIPVIPAIQMDVIISYREHDFPPEEFKKTLDYALSENSSGVIIFANNWNSLVADFAKKKIIQETVSQK